MCYVFVFLSAVFEAVEAEAAAAPGGGAGEVTPGGVVEYSVTRCTMEDVFLGFAAEARRAEGLEEEEEGEPTSLG